MAAKLKSISLVVAALIALVAARPVVSEERLEWIGWSGEGAASLVYGIANSDHVILSLACQEGGGPVMLVYPHEPKGAEDGAFYSLDLRSGDRNLTISTKGVRLEMDDLFILEGELQRKEDLVGLLNGGETLTVVVGQDVTELPLAGASVAGSAFLEVCGR